MANQTRGHHAPSEQAWAGSEIPAELARQIDPVDACDFSQVLDPAAGRITGNRVSDTRKPGRCLPWHRKPFASPGQGQQVDHRLVRSDEHTSDLQSLMRTSYAVFCLKKKKK